MTPGSQWWKYKDPFTTFFSAAILMGNLSIILYTIIICPTSDRNKATLIIMNLHTFLYNRRCFITLPSPMWFLRSIKPKRLEYALSRRFFQRRPGRYCFWIYILWFMLRKIPCWWAGVRRFGKGGGLNPMFSSICKFWSWCFGNEKLVLLRNWR